MVVPAVLAEAASDPSMCLDWTSGYFSVRKAHREALVRCHGPVRIVCASPEVRVPMNGQLLPHLTRSLFRQTDSSNLRDSRNTFRPPIPILKGCSLKKSGVGVRMKAWPFSSGSARGGHTTRKVHFPPVDLTLWLLTYSFGRHLAPAIRRLTKFHACRVYELRLSVSGQRP